MPMVIPFSASLSSLWPETKQQQDQQQDRQQHHQQQKLVVHKQQENNTITTLLDCKDMEQIQIIRQIGEGKMKRVSTK